MSRSTRLVSVKVRVGFFIFSLPFRFIKVYIFAQQKHVLFTSLHHSFQNENTMTAIHSFAPRPLIFKLQQVLKFDDIFVSWSSPKLTW